MQAQLPMNPYALSAEGRRFLRFLLTDAETHDVRFAALD